MDNESSLYPRRTHTEQRLPKFEVVPDERDAFDAEPLAGKEPFNIAMRVFDSNSDHSVHMDIVRSMIQSQEGRSIVMDAMHMMCTDGWLTEDDVARICPAPPENGVIRISPRVPYSSERATAEVDVNIHESHLTVFNQRRPIDARFTSLFTPTPATANAAVAEIAPLTDTTTTTVETPTRDALDIMFDDSPPSSDTETQHRSTTSRHHHQMLQRRTISTVPISTDRTHPSSTNHPENHFRCLVSPKWAADLSTRYKTLAYIATNVPALSKIKGLLSTPDGNVPILSVMTTLDNSQNHEENAFLDIQRHACRAATNHKANAMVAHDILMITYKNEGHNVEPTAAQWQERFPTLGKPDAKEVRESFDRAVLWESEKGNVIYTLLVGAVMMGKLAPSVFNKWKSWSDMQTRLRPDDLHSINNVLDFAAQQIGITPHKASTVKFWSLAEYNKTERARQSDLRQTHALMVSHSHTE